MSVNKELKELIAVLKSCNCVVTIGKNHYKVVLGDRQMSFAASPSDYRAFLNIRRDIRLNLGFDIRDYGWTK